MKVEFSQELYESLRFANKGEWIKHLEIDVEIRWSDFGSDSFMISVLDKEINLVTTFHVSDDKIKDTFTFSPQDKIDIFNVLDEKEVKEIKQNYTLLMVKKLEHMFDNIRWKESYIARSHIKRMEEKLQREESQCGQ